MSDPDYQGETGHPLHNGSEEESAWNQEIPQGCFSVLPCSVIKVDGKLQQPHSGWTANVPASLEKKSWVTLPGKEPCLVEVLAEGKENME